MQNGNGPGMGIQKRVTESVGIQADITRNSFFDHTSSGNTQLRNPAEETASQWILDKEKLPYQKKKISPSKFSPKNQPIASTSDQKLVVVVNPSSKEFRMNPSYESIEESSHDYLETLNDKPQSNNRLAPFMGIANPLQISQTLTQTRASPVN